MGRSRAGLRQEQWRGASLLAGLWLLTLPAQAETLKAVFERAWRLAPSARIVEAQRGEAEASQQVASSLLAGAPQVSLAHRSDRWNDGLGKQESEIAVALPLWMPGQRAARQRLAEADGSENQRGIAAARLMVAGELRTALWALVLANHEVEIAQTQRDAVLKLEADVARRVKAGDLARTDLLLARQESSAAKLALAEAEVQRVRASQRYRVLTGSDALPDDPREALKPAAGGGANDHPGLLASRATADRARAGLLLAQSSRRDAPSLAIQLRRDRDATGLPERDSVGFALAIPLATEARNAPLIARANTEVIRADALHLRRVAEVAAEEKEAEAWLESARLSVELSSAREQAASERLELMQRAFALGEGALAELLRAQSQAHAARVALARSQARLAAAEANLNQARGITP